MDRTAPSARMIDETPRQPKKMSEPIMQLAQRKKGLLRSGRLPPRPRAAPGKLKRAAEKVGALSHFAHS
jgi:hypothetical protein